MSKGEMAAYTNGLGKAMTKEILLAMTLAALLSVGCGAANAPHASRALSTPTELPTTTPSSNGPRGTILGLGFQCSYASKFLRDKYRLPPGKGCVVLRVGAGSSAERAGIKIGDEIVEENGVPVTGGRQISQVPLDRPGTQHFVVQRANDRGRLDVGPGGSAALPANDPYFFFLRGKNDADGNNFARSIADYSKAIELEPGFDLAYLYRGDHYYRFGTGPDALGRATADVEKAMELDPEVPEGYFILGEILLDQHDLDGAITQLNRAIDLNRCGPAAQWWDSDCGEDFLERAALLLKRLDAGDDVKAEADINASNEVNILAAWETDLRFLLAYVRGDDAAAKQRASEFLNASTDSPGVQSDQSYIRQAVQSDPPYLRYLTGLFEGNGSDCTRGAGQYFPSDPDTGKPTLNFSVVLPNASPHQHVYYELKRGDYRIGSNSGDLGGWMH